MAKKKTAKLTDTAVETIRHKDKRKNIPTEELRDLYRDEPGKMLYPRDPSLDPQLVWKGKDEQDGQPLEVPVLPIYIQEKIHPQAIIEDLRRRAEEEEERRVGAAAKQLDLFGDFNGLTPLQKIDFYRYDAHWTNRMIQGDSLAVMTSLAEKEGLKGQVQCIYIDPPYGIRFGSNWQVSTRKRDVKDGKVEDATRQPEQIRAFRDTWELGIHSYLAYLRERLTCARELLTESGSVFVQIGDENVHLVRSILDEVFGSQNFHAQINFKSTSALGQQGLRQAYDYIIWYAKNIEAIKFRGLYKTRDVGDDREWRLIDDGNAEGGYRRISEGEFRDLLSTTGLFRRAKLTSSGFTQTCIYEFDLQGIRCRPFGGKSWLTTRDGMQRLTLAGRLFVLGNSPYAKQYFDDFPVLNYDNSWSDQPAAESRIYVVQTAEKFIERCLLMTTDPGDLVLDPTCGSGTTAYVAEQWGRRWITCDTSRVALALARTRLMAARYPYYLLADSPEGVAKEAELSPLSRRDHAATPRLEAGAKQVDTRLEAGAKQEGDIKKGFVYRRVPHVTLKSIANNEEIDAIHARWQPEIEAALAALNKATGNHWQEWEVPRPDRLSPGPQAGDRRVGVAAKRYWDIRRQRQKEIDASIARTANQELLYDQPYEDHKRLRVTGPFTVESLSPHRRLTVQDKVEGTKQVPGWQTRVIGPDKFGTAIIENLRKAGIQTRERRERLKFDNLQPFAGEWIHATGEFTDADGEQKRVAVCIGPEHGTVGPELVKEAAKEASRGLGFDLLYVCGFAFDPHVDEEAKRYGNLNVQICRMNPDLSMGDELLKKTGAGNLFMVFGEPDIAIKRVRPVDGPVNRRVGAAAKHEDGLPEQFAVEIRGVDVYDPTTGEIRNNSTDDIACWFIDTDYDEDSFFVRHAYFTGADQPYEKLKRALRADIDESAWSALYSTVSQPFPMPGKKGKIAVKVINHYGDEVLKVYGPKDFAKAKG